jgi:hypothetical protein
MFGPQKATPSEFKDWRGLLLRILSGGLRVWEPIYPLLYQLGDCHLSIVSNCLKFLASFSGEPYTNPISRVFAHDV